MLYERLGVARYTLAVISGFGAIAALLDYLAGNYVVVGFGAFALVTGPVALWLSRQPRFRQLPISFTLVLVITMHVVGSLTQLHHSANLVWMPLFPFFFFNLAGLRWGTALTAGGLLLTVIAYQFYPALHPAAPVATMAFTQALSAYSFGAMLGYLYERSRSAQAARLAQQAVHDYLTGIPNRRGLTEHMESLRHLSQRKRYPFSFVLFDVDDFKAINDIHGHHVGDDTLVALTTLVRSQLRGSDILGRWGGEEFALVLCDEHLDGALAVAEKLRRQIAGHSVPVVGRITVSFGVTEFAAGDDLAGLLRRADTALYRAKQRGKNRVESEAPAHT
jgi:diguanylate cyclase (GGDEF)-like protein